MNFQEAQQEARRLGTAKYKESKPRRIRTARVVVLGVLSIAFFIHLSLKLIALVGDEATQKAAQRAAGVQQLPVQEPLKPLYKTVIAPAYRVLPQGKKPEASDFPGWEQVTGANCLHSDRGNYWVKTRENGVEVVRHRSEWVVAEGETGKLEDSRVIAFLSGNTKMLEVGTTQYPPGYQSGGQFVCPPVTPGRHRR